MQYFCFQSRELRVIKIKFVILKYSIFLCLFYIDSVKLEMFAINFGLYVIRKNTSSWHYHGVATKIVAFLKKSIFQKMRSNTHEGDAFFY